MYNTYQHNMSSSTVCICVERLAPCLSVITGNHKISNLLGQSSDQLPVRENTRTIVQRYTMCNCMQNATCCYFSAAQLKCLLGCAARA